MNSKSFYVYFLTNLSNSVIYVGVTNNLIKRVYEHKNKIVAGFTSKYNVSKLVYYEGYKDVLTALTREKQIKAGSRQKKIDLITENNPKFSDLYQEII